MMRVYVNVMCMRFLCECGVHSVYICMSVFCVSVRCLWGVEVYVRGSVCVFLCL